jgi:predicted alpha/beta hydrolase family esterase
MKPVTGLVLLAPLPFVVNAAAVDPDQFEVRAVEPREANPNPEPSVIIAPRQDRTLEGESSPTPTRTLEGESYCVIL